MQEIELKDQTLSSKNNSLIVLKRTRTLSLQFVLCCFCTNPFKKMNTKKALKSDAEYERVGNDGAFIGG